MVNIYTKLATIQKSIKVPKDLNNDFAGFKYRSAEGILEKLKPLLENQKVVVLLTDEIEDHSEQSYVKAWARMVNCEEPREFIEVSALAREEKTRPKMSEGQLTGAASSYARKYALNGLLLLDDCKDPDSQDNTKRSKPTAVSVPQNGIKKRMATMPQIKLMVDKVKWGLKTHDKDEVVNWLWNVLGKELTQIESSEVDGCLQKIDKALREDKVAGKIYEAMPDEINDSVPVTDEDLEQFNNGKMNY